MEMDGWDDSQFWSGALEEDTTLSLEGLEESFWSRGFLPPPPRPPFLELDIPTDGLTTCDLCTWATDIHSITSRSSLGFFPWSITLIIVSVLSALIGAALMVSLRQCFKRVNNNRTQLGYTEEDGTSRGEGGSVDKSRTDKRRQGEGGVWCWLSRRPPTIQAPVEVSATNHYTDEAYAGVEALYAELDKPVYQNTGYVLDTDAGSPPSSAYYSDFSERTYETVGGNTWEMCQLPLSRQRLSAISEAAVHSDYV